MEKKYVLVTGGTGGIGQEIIQLVAKHGNYVLCLVRNTARAHEIHGDNPHILIDECNLENEESVAAYLRKKKNEGIIPSVIILAAGRFKWDDDKMFDGNTIEEKLPHAKQFLITANFTTKESFITALHEVFTQEELKEIKLVVVSSQAAKFHVGHPLRDREEAYVTAQKMVSDLADSESVKAFKEFIVLEPALISTDAAKEEFQKGKGTMTETPNWEVEKKATVFAEELLKDAGLI